MSESLSALSNRTMSSYPVSIGTALALESIDIGPNQVYDPERKIPNVVDLNNYDEVWVCLFTLFRNIFNSLNTTDAARCLPIDIATVMEQERIIIETLVNNKTNGRCQVKYYASDYANLNKEYPYARLRNDTTPKQLMYSQLMVKSVQYFYKKHSNRDKYLHFKLHINPSSSDTRCLIFTNYAHDLLSFNKFKTLDLLESHTGILKSKSAWYTKYQNGKELVRIPFNKVFLQVFGDSHTFFAWPKPARDSIIELSEKYKWTQNTTKDRIIYCLHSMTDAYMQTILRTMF